MNNTNKVKNLLNEYEYKEGIFNSENREKISNNLKSISLNTLNTMKNNENNENDKKLLDKLIEIKKSSNNKSNNSNKKKCKALPEFSDKTKEKEELIDTLIKINGNLFGNKNGTRVVTALLKIINDEQETLKERQEIIKDCLYYYNDILDNYYDESIKIKNFQKIAESLGLGKNKQPAQIFN